MAVGMFVTFYHCMCLCIHVCDECAHEWMGHTGKGMSLYY